MLEEKLLEWVKKVVNVHGENFVDTYAMLEEVDKIIAEAFDHEPVL